MADNLQVFEDSMARGRDFQAKNQWENALREYYKAATEVKTDLEARAGVANALAKLGRNDQAFTQYQALVKVRPNNPELVRGFAETLTKLGRKEEAIAAFYRLRDIAKENNQPIQRIEALSDVITLDDSRTDAYFEIIEIYAAQGDKPSAAAVGVELSRYYKRAGDYKQALEIITDVIQIDPNNADAPALKAELEKGPPAPSTKKPQSAELDFGDLPDLDMLESMAATVMATNPVNSAPAKPDVEESADTVVIRQETSAPVAATITATDSARLIADAEMFLERGETGPAIRHYEMAVEAGAHRADVFYSLGQLYAQENQAEPSIKYLQKAAADPEYATSAYFSLGQVYDALGQLAESGEAYGQALASMDMSGIDESSIDELIDMYDMAVDVYQRNLNPEKAAELYQKLAVFIQQNNLRTDKAMLVLVKSREMNEALQPPEPEASTNGFRAESTDGLAEFGEEGGTGSKLPGFSSSISFGTATEDDFIKTIGTNGHLGQDSVSDFLESNTNGGLALAETKLSAPSEPTIPAIFPEELIRLEPNQYATPYLRAAEDFIRRDLTMAAMDACHEIIRYFPGYLPAQAILSEIYVKKGWLEQARQKYQFLVDLYNTREDKVNSIWCYKRLANISPNNFSLRSKLANLMMGEGMNAEAAELLLDNIDNFVRSGQTERALEECKRLRALAPNSAPIRLQYGDLLNRLDRHSEALGEFRRALELDPNNLRALALLNITIFLTDSSDVRWTSLNSVIEAMSKDNETRNSLVSEYRQMLMLFNHAGLNYAMGCFLLLAEQKSAAERSFDETLRIASITPNMKDYELLSRWELGQLLLESGRTQQAVDSLSKIVNLLESVDASSFAPSTMRFGSLPSQAVIYRKLAQGFNADGQPEYALKALKTVKKLIPYDRDLYFEMAELYFSQGQLPEALGELGELADHYEQVNQTEKVIDVLREMVRLAPNRIEVRDKLSQVYLNRGMTDEGLAELDELAELQRKNGRMKDAVRTLQRGAEIYFMMARMDKAYELYDRIVRIAPGDLDARQHLVNLHILAGRPKDAIEEQRTIAQICLQSGNSQDAIGALHQVIGLSPNDTRAYFTLADILKGVGKFGEAYRLYKRIVKLEPNNDKAKTLLTQVKQKAIDAGQLEKE